MVLDFGIEIEFTRIPFDDAKHLTPPDWILVSDGSVRGRGIKTEGGVIKVDKHYSRILEEFTVTTGGEFVSPPISSINSGWRDSTSDLLMKLFSLDEPLSPKASIHVHVDIGSLSLTLMKNLVILFAHLEDFVYRISCGEMGTHRGMLRHDYGYCRPICEKGPPVAYDRDGIPRQVFTTQTLLNATSKTEFRKALGRGDLDGRKYVEARYVGLNLLPIWRQNTCEFRTFNMTKRMNVLVAWVKFCRALTNTASIKPKLRLPEMPLGTFIKTGVGQTPEYVSALIGMDLKDLKLVYDLGSWCDPVVGYQEGHLNKSVDWDNCPEDIIPPQVVDKIYTFDSTEVDNVHDHRCVG